MGLISVFDELPEINEDVICLGVDEKGTMIIEEGFRSAVDNKNNQTSWVDFSYTVTHWAYVPDEYKIGE